MCRLVRVICTLGALGGMTIGCAHQAPPAETPNEVLQAKEDLRFKLAQLTIALGEALPQANATDALGIETLPGATHVFLAKRA